MNMKFTPVKLAQKGTLVVKPIAEGEASMTSMETESTFQLDHVWFLLNMPIDDVTRKPLKKDLEIEDILDFQLITQDELDYFPK